MELQKAFQEFSNESEETKKEDLFLQLLIAFDYFIILEPNKNISYAYVPQYLKEILDHFMQNSGNIPILIQLMKVLCKAVFVPNVKINPKTYCFLLENCCKISELYPAIFQISETFFRKVLNDKEFFHDFASFGCIEHTFSKIFVSIHSTTSAKFYLSLMFDDVDAENGKPKEYFEAVNFQIIMQYIESIITDDQITEDMSEYCALFIANLFKNVSFSGKQISSFFKMNCFSFFDYLVQKSPFSSRIDCYKPLIYSYNDDGSQPPNYVALKHIYNVFADNPLMQEPIFTLICELLQIKSKNI